MISLENDELKKNEILDFYLIFQLFGNCPRLERVHLAGNTISSGSSFTFNLDLFLVQATKIKRPYGIRIITF